MEEKLKERLMSEFHFQDAVGFGVCVEMELDKKYSLEELDL